MTVRVWRAWNVEALTRAVGEVAGAEDAVAVSWADADGNAVSRRSWPGTPPQLAVGVVVRDIDAEELIRRLPGFVRLTSQEDEDLDGEACRVVRAIFSRVAGPA